jgi:hypothetical protein
LERHQAGELIEARLVTEYTAGLSLLVRDHLLAQADRLAPVLAAVDDEKAAYRLIREDNERLLRRLSKAVSELPR